MNRLLGLYRERPGKNEKCSHQSLFPTMVEASGSFSSAVSAMEPSPTSKLSLSLHDSLSLGEIELGLSANHRPSLEEVRRLPILLRLLSSSRPLSSIPTFPLPTQDETEEIEEPTSDEIIEEAVNRLEDRAALYSAAEGVEVVACHLAPFVCRKMSRLAPLQKNGLGEFRTEELSLLVSNPAVSSRAKRLKLSSVAASAQQHKSSADAILSDDSQAAMDDNERGFMSDEDMIDIDSTNNSKRRRGASDRESLPAAGDSEDSQEATVIKTLSELASLVIRSLKSTPDSEDDADIGESGTLALTIEDSILAEGRQGSTAMGSVCGAMVTSDLGSMVAALMHHAPVLRHRHIASALCRAAVPQTSDLIGSMGANCPAAVPCLLRGCLDVCRLVEKAACRNLKIETAVKKSIQALAKLSERETSRVRTVLRQQNALLDLQLELALGQDPVAAACLLIEHLSREVIREQQDVPSEKVALDGISRPRNAKLVRPIDDESQRISLLTLLELDADLLHRVFRCLDRELSSQSSQSKSWGRDCILLTAFAWLMFRVRLDELFKNSAHGFKTLTPIIETVCSLADALNNDSEDQSTTKLDSHLDRPSSLILCAVVSTLAQTVAMDRDGGNPEIERCTASLRVLMGHKGVSLKTNALLARFASILQYKNVPALRDAIEDVLLQRPSAPDLPVFSQTTELWKRLSSGCESVMRHSGIDFDSVIDRCVNTESFVMDQAAMLELVRLPQDAADSSQLSRIRQTLKAILEDPRSSLSHLRSSILPAFIRKATSLLLLDAEPKVPIVLPLQIEKLALQIDLQRQHPLGKLEAQFLLQFLYSFAFIEEEPASPFGVSDFRALPMREILILCDTAPMNCLSDALRSMLKHAVDQLCPEVLIQSHRYRLQVESRQNTASETTEVNSTKRKRLLLYVLRKSVSKPEEDPLGLLAERSFILARAQLTDAALFTTVATTLMSKTGYYSYSLLYRDPLVLLKCPTNIWARKGWRRIVITVLSSLLETNEVVTRHSSPLTDTRGEMLAVRDIIVVRCLITAMCTAPLDRYCTLASALVRRTVAKHPSLVGTLLKQGLTEASLDFLVQFVPEIMDHSLETVLSDRSSLTMAERLVAADGVLRIAVAHGHRAVVDAKALAYAALAQLIASFFLVIGPVGVPVNALVSGSGLDATQTARRATFRMLKCLAKVDGYRTGLRNECLMALQKLAGLAKGESIISGLSNSVASRQKNLLKEILDAIFKANNAMGSGMQI